MEMGLLPGTRIEMVRRAPLGDPLEIRLRGYLLSVNSLEAADVHLAPDGQADPDVYAAGGNGRESAVPTRFATHPPGDGAPHERPSRVLVAGNANSGKSTIFNALTGARAKVGNYPGVTVTRASREVELRDGARVEVVDLPGTYSLSAYSPDEQVAVDEVLGRRGHLPDTVVVVVDSVSLERGLYLGLQIVETGVPVVVALNMLDEALAAGIEVDAARLSDWLGVTVVPMVASAGEGIDALRDAISRSVRLAAHDAVDWPGFPPAVQTAVDEVERSLDDAPFVRTPAERRSWAIWSLLSHSNDEDDVVVLPDGVRRTIDDVRRRATDAQVELSRDVIATRYRWIEAAVGDARRVDPAAASKVPWTDRIDAVLIHKVWGMGTFAVVMWGLFEALFAWSEPFIGAIETVTVWLQNGVRGLLPTGALQDLAANGVIAGVGNVVVFVPQIALIMFFIAVLEDVGYLARVAFVIDRLMGLVGLHGKAFVPMLSGFACAIPAVMATRTIESRRDRLIPMLTLPMISCSARLPVFALVTAVVFAGSGRLLGLFSTGAVVLLAMYALSVSATLGAAAVLRRTVLRGPRLPLVLELPPYRMPVWRDVFLATWRAVRNFLEDAGTIILTLTVILWALLSYPRSAEIVQRYDAQRVAVEASAAAPEAQAEQIALLNGEEAGEQIRYSVAGRVGRLMEPAIEPLGFDWRIGVGILGAFAAREVFVSTLGIVFGLEEADEESVTLRTSLQEAEHPDGSTLMTPLAGVSLMVFFVLACQCMSTVVVVRRESGSWGWPVFMFAYMSVLAYVAALLVYQTGALFGWGL